MTLRPLPSEHGVDEESGFPIFSGFGTAVAIRNGIAFVGIPRPCWLARRGLRSNRYAGWVRTATLTVPDAPVFGKNGFGRAIVFRDGLAVIASSHVPARLQAYQRRVDRCPEARAAERRTRGFWESVPCDSRTEFWS